MDPNSRDQLRIRIDAHTRSRLEALRLLMMETGCPFHRERILREALLLGLDLMLGEVLEQEGPMPRESVLHTSSISLGH